MLRSIGLIFGTICKQSHLPLSLLMFEHLHKIITAMQAVRVPPPSSPALLRKQTGDVGEQLAVEYLKKNTKLRVLKRNWSDGRQEIDIICKDGEVLVFVEVRARKATSKVPGYATLTQKKRRNLRKGAFSYMRQLKTRPHTYRYDAIELRMNGTFAEAIHHFQNIKVF